MNVYTTYPVFTNIDITDVVVEHLPDDVRSDIEAFFNDVDKTAHYVLRFEIELDADIEHSFYGRTVGEKSRTLISAHMTRKDQLFPQLDLNDLMNDYSGFRDAIQEIMDCEVMNYLENEFLCDAADNDGQYAIDMYKSLGFI